MAPTTRAGTKRGRVNTTTTKPTDVKEKRQIKKAKKDTGVSDASATTKVTNTRCRLLELPPEIRNRIYHFAAYDYGIRLHPPLLHRSIPATPQVDGWRSFLSLAQTCTQLRAEYRPLWLRALKPNVNLQQVGKFVKTFYPSTTDYQHAPRELYICFSPTMDGQTGLIHKLTPLLRMRAFNSKVNLKFVPYNVVKDIVPDECEYCELMGVYEGDEVKVERYHGPLDCTCGGMYDFDYKDWEIDMYDDIEEYVHPLAAFFTHDNEAWQKDLRELDMKVTCFYNEDDSKRWTFQTIFRSSNPPELRRVGSPSALVRAYLHARGMFRGQIFYGFGFDVSHVVRYIMQTKTKFEGGQKATCDGWANVHIMPADK